MKSVSIHAGVVLAAMCAVTLVLTDIAHQLNDKGGAAQQLNLVEKALGGDISLLDLAAGSNKD